jgi:hypothetical protein
MTYEYRSQNDLIRTLFSFFNHRLNELLSSNDEEANATWESDKHEREKAQQMENVDRYREDNLYPQSKINGQIGHHSE